MKIFIMRGISGVGKSTWIERHKRRAIHTEPFSRYVTFSADFYHFKDGKYEFDPKNAAAAHISCFSEYLRMIQVKDVERNWDTIFVDNTNTSAWEIAPYVRLAEVLGHDWEIIRLEVDPYLAFSRSQHGTPLATVLQMWQNLRTERLPPWWKERVELGTGGQSCKE